MTPDSADSRPTPGSLRVLMLTDYFLPGASGGVERAAYEVARRLVARGQAVSVMTLRRRGEPPSATMDGIAVSRVPGIDLSRRLGVQVALSAHVWPELRRALRSGSFDLVHAHTLFFHSSLAGAVLAKRYGVPLVTTAHLGPPQEIGGLAGRLTSLYEAVFGRYILNASDAVIAVSEAVGRHMARLMREPGRITVVPNGVDLERFSPAGGAAAGPPVVLFVGRLIFNKGPHLLLRAVPAVLARVPEARFRFVGDGPLRAELEETARRLGVSDRVEFLGQREDVEALMRQAALLARPSLSEGLPLVALEAMACGLPVVASAAGGTAEVVREGETGYIVAPEDSRRLAERICALLTDADLRRRLGQNGRRLVEQGYDWESVTGRTLQVYRSALAGRP